MNIHSERTAPEFLQGHSSIVAKIPALTRPIHLRAGPCYLELEACGGYFVTCVSLRFRSRLYLAELHPRALGGEWLQFCMQQRYWNVLKIPWCKLWSLCFVSQSSQVTLLQFNLCGGFTASVILEMCMVFEYLKYRDQCNADIVCEVHPCVRCSECINSKLAFVFKMATLFQFYKRKKMDFCNRPPAVL